MILIDLIWVFIMYDLSFVHIHNALYKFLKSHWMSIDEIGININLETLKRTMTQFDFILWADWVNSQQ